MSSKPQLMLSLFIYPNSFQNQDLTIVLLELLLSLAVIFFNYNDSDLLMAKCKIYLYREIENNDKYGYYAKFLIFAKQRKL